MRTSVLVFYWLWSSDVINLNYDRISCWMRTPKLRTLVCICEEVMTLKADSLLVQQVPWCGLNFNCHIYPCSKWMGLVFSRLFLVLIAFKHLLAASYLLNKGSRSFFMKIIFFQILIFKVLMYQIKDNHTMSCSCFYFKENIIKELCYVCLQEIEFKI